MKLVAKNIKKTYGNKKVLDDISIYVNEKEIVSLLGVSGIGKTTLFNILSGLTNPDSGEIYIDGDNVTKKTGKISYMLQKDLLLPHKTIVDNIALPFIIKGVKRKDAYKEVEKYFYMFGIEGEQKRYPQQLSGGMRQRAALLRTYINSKDLVLLDEPFSALDEITRQSMQEWYIKVSKELSLTTIFITHDIDEAILLSDRVYILREDEKTPIIEIAIDSKEKENKDFLFSKEFINYKKNIKKKL